MIAARSRDENPLLTRLMRLTALSDGDLGAIDDLCGDVRTFRARVGVTAQGRRVDRLYVVLDGWACTYRLLADGRRQIVALMVPGDVCNLDVLHLRHSDHAIGTITPCTFAAVSQPAMCDLMAGRRDVADAMAWLMALQNAMLAERNTCLGRRTAREHVAHLLCELMIRLTLVGRAGPDGYTLPLIQEEIADVLGLTSVHVNRVVQGLRREALIVLAGKDLTIMDWNRLRDTAGFRADYLHLEGMDGSGTTPASPSWPFEGAEGDRAAAYARR